MGGQGLRYSGHIPSVIKVRADNEDRNLEIGTKAEAGGGRGWGGLGVGFLACSACSLIHSTPIINQDNVQQTCGYASLTETPPSQVILAYAKLTKQSKTTWTPTIKRHTHRQVEMIKTINDNKEVQADRHLSDVFAIITFSFSKVIKIFRHPPTHEL